MDTADKMEVAEYHASIAARAIKEVQEDIEQMKRDKKASEMELTNRQAGRIIGVSESTIIRMKKDGRLDSLKFVDVFEYAKNNRKS